MHLNGENCQNFILTGKTLWKWANGLNIYDSEKKGPQGQVFPHPGQYTCIHVYYHNIQRSFSLKPFGLVEYS